MSGIWAKLSDWQNSQSGLIGIMNKSFIQITRHLYEEPHHANLVILASNGLASGGLEFYVNTSQIKEIAQGLVSLPRLGRVNYLFELGSERPEDNFGFYFRLRAFGKNMPIYADNSKTNCYIQLRMNNNDSMRDGFLTTAQLVDFTIEADFESVRNLGKSLTIFAKLKHQRLVWTPKNSFVDNDLKFRESITGDNIEAALASLSI